MVHENAYFFINTFGKWSIVVVLTGPTKYDYRKMYRTYRDGIKGRKFLGSLFSSSIHRTETERQLKLL